jgi:hypothetical protein
MPIIFKPFSVRAILDEKKFRTTRIRDTHKMEPGDRFWVRETWAFDKNGINIIYKPDFFEKEKSIKWKSPLIMSKAACRLILHVKKKYKQKLMDMTEKDAIAEGIREIETGKYPVFISKNLDISTTLYVDNPILSFISMWDWINSSPYSWVDDLFVFEFEKEVVR